jgi:UDP-arabinose 4-epimerase
MTRNILVTGGAGYVGSHVAQALSAAGYIPITVDDLGRGSAQTVQWGPLERGSILDRDFLDRVFGLWQPEAVLHLAAFAYVGESVADPALYYRNNVVGSLTLLEIMRNHGVHEIVVSSTCAIYGTPVHCPISEDHPCAPINPYGASKLVIERMLADFSAAYTTRSVALRYFNAAGADPDGRIGEAHEPETHLIPLAIGAALGTAPPLKILGADYPTPDGTCIRDYIHVVDLAAAHVAALHYLKAGGANTACNLGTGIGLSVRTIVREVERLSGSPVPTITAARRVGDPPILVADARRARQMLGWMPIQSDIGAIVTTALSWARSRADAGQRVPPATLATAGDAADGHLASLSAVTP